MMQSRLARQGSILACCVALLVLMHLSGAMQALNSQVARRLAFSLRLSLGATPPLDSRIKIFAWDDKTTQLLTKWGLVNSIDLPLVSWARFFEWVGAAQPKAIYIDKMFQNPYGGVDGADAFVATLKRMSVPVVAGGYLTTEQHTFATTLPKSRPEYRPYELSKPIVTERYFYGPHAKVLDGFARVGHIFNADAGFISGLEHVDAKTAVAHWSLALAEDIPEAVSGPVLVNLVDQVELSTRSRSMGWALSEMADGRAVSGVSPGDVVVILPSAYTGGTDFKDTVLGRMPGGYIQTSMLNSQLTGAWLKTLNGGWLLDLLAILVAAFAATRLRPNRFWPLTAIALVVTLIGGLVLFINFGVDVVWLPPLMSFFLVGSALAIEGHFETFLTNVSLQTDLKLGEAVQSLCLPVERTGRFAGYSYRIGFRPFGPMSGDWMQSYVNRGDGPGPSAILAIGDVVGKGPRAALATTVIASGFLRLTRQGFEHPEDVLHELDAVMEETFRGKQNTTMSFASIQREDVLVFACGAPQWLHARTAGDVVPVKTKPSKLLGFQFGSTAFYGSRVSLAPGELLIAYTDGVLDGMVLRNRFQKQLAAALKSLAADAAIDEIYETVDRVATALGKTMNVEDDFTLLVLRRERD